jgi:nitrite reductase/ring-hydroxylating ferredoxin subunit
MTQVSVCRIDEVPADTTLCRRLPGGPSVAVARVTNSDTGFAVFENRCPHANGPLGEGRVKDNSVVCPWHFFRFDLGTGKALGMESIMEVKRYAVSVSGGEIRIEF